MNSLSYGPKTVNPRPEIADNPGRYRLSRARAIIVLIFLSLISLSVATKKLAFNVDDSYAPYSEHGSPVQSTINPNTASWHELAQLPGIGEAIGRRIVMTRDLLLHIQLKEQPVFVVPQDLRRVRGIGPRTLQRIQPFLRFAETYKPR